MQEERHACIMGQHDYHQWSLFHLFQEMDSDACICQKLAIDTVSHQHQNIGLLVSGFLVQTIFKSIYKIGLKIKSLKKKFKTKS